MPPCEAVSLAQTIAPFENHLHASRAHTRHGWKKCATFDKYLRIKRLTAKIGVPGVCRGCAGAVPLGCKPLRSHNLSLCHLQCIDNNALMGILVCKPHCYQQLRVCATRLAAPDRLLRQSSTGQAEPRASKPASLQTAHSPRTRPLAGWRSSLLGQPDGPLSPK